MRQILIIIGISVLLYSTFNGDFDKKKSLFVTDNIAGLVWQDDYSDNEGVIKKDTWRDASLYCEELILGEKVDWRLPNDKELKSLVHNRVVNSQFTNISYNHYWSSSSSESDSSNAWSVDLHGGYEFWDDKSNMLDVKCVRDK